MRIGCSQYRQAPGQRQRTAQRVLVRRRHNERVQTIWDLLGNQPVIVNGHRNQPVAQSLDSSSQARIPGGLNADVQHWPSN